MTECLLLESGERVPLTRDYFTVGYGPACDYSFGEKKDEILFSVRKVSGAWLVTLLHKKSLFNGKHVSSEVKFGFCDRVSWPQGAAVLVPGVASVQTGTDASSGAVSEGLGYLIKDALHADGPGLRGYLRWIQQLTSAETVVLLSSRESEEKEWTVLASNPASSAGTSKTLLSNTVLNEALKTRKAVQVDNVGEHAFRTAASLMASDAGSVACLPLVMEGQVLGALYLAHSKPALLLQEKWIEALSLLSLDAILLFSDQPASRTNVAGAKSPSLLHFRSSSMIAVADRVARLAESNLNVLVWGETGTGKELLSREIHRLSARAKGPFVVLNCGAIPPSLIESTLFGYVKGAFTGATEDRLGKFALADGGTLFLDEIGELPLEVQTRLLRVLQEKTVEPIGGREELAVDFRLVAATHRDLQKLVAEGKFREDLFYRLNGALVKVPSLRERGSEEILFLAKHFLSEKAPGKALSADAEAALIGHPWPGNVRELEQVIARGAVFAEGREIAPDDLEIEGASASLPALDGIVLRRGRNEYSRELVEKVLHRTSGNRARAAELLGVSERTVYRILAVPSA